MSFHNEYRPENTVYVGNLNEKVTTRLLYELFVQAGPIEVVTIPKPKEGQSRFFGFVEFKDVVSVGYACELMHGIELFRSALVVRPQNAKQPSSNSAPRPTYTDSKARPSYNDRVQFADQRYPPPPLYGRPTHPYPMGVASDYNNNYANHQNYSANFDSSHYNNNNNNNRAYARPPPQHVNPNPPYYENPQKGHYNRKRKHFNN